MKQNIRGFLAGFLISLLFILLVFGMLFINFHVQKTGSPDYAPLLETENSRNAYAVSVMGTRIYIDKTMLNRAEPYLQKLSVFLPAQVRALAAGFHGLGMAVRGEPLLPGPVPGYSLVPGASGNQP